MTPVAGGIADGEEHGLVIRADLFKSLIILD